MRPRKLEVEAFTAFRTRQEIDFTRLELFVITGPTGAGKTSLLDAMALALYGQVPRMGKQGLGQLVSHGAAEARVLLEFEAGGEVLRVARRLPRRGSQSARFERFDGERWIDLMERGGVTAVNAAVGERIALDFESFCKAVVLPQGEFARFLRGDPGERRATLVTLLGLKAYEEMAAKARARASELSIRGAQTRTILAEQYADATAEALTVAEAEALTAEAAAAAAARRLTSGREHEARRVESATRAESAGAFAARFEGLGQQLSGEIARCREAEAAAATAATARARESEAATAALAVLTRAEAERARVRERSGAREELARLIDAAERRPLLGRRVEDAAKQLDTARARVDTLADALEAATTEAASAATAATDARAAEAPARQAAESLGGERSRLQRVAEAADRAAAAIAKAEGEVATAGASASAADSSASRADAAREAAEASLAALRRDHVVAGLVAGLTVGDDCPVCERPLAEHPSVDADVEGRLATADAGCVAARAAAERARAERTGAHSRVAVADGRLGDARASLAEALAEHGRREGLDAALLDATRRADAAVASLEAVVDAIERASAATNAAEVALERARNELAAARSQHVLRDEGHVAALRERDATDELLRSRFGSAGIPADALAQLAASRTELVNAESATEAAQTAADEARERLQAANAAHALALTTLGEIDVGLGTLRARVEETLAEVRRSAALPALDRLPDPAPVRDERASTLASWCAAATTALSSARAVLADAAQRAGDALIELAPPAPTRPDAAEALASLIALERQSADARVRAAGIVETLALRVGQREVLEARLAGDATQIAVLEILARELRADHFIDFIVQETLDVLALRASDELHRISDGRYSLVSIGGQFSVVDHVNADEQRSVKTLSGGETFMASLSLALALSKHVTELAGEGLGARLEAVFIDEGFGTLDPDTLEEVIDALERLRDDDLIVGVISHVPALAARIGAGLEVRKEGNRSIVTETR